MTKSSYDRFVDERPERARLAFDRSIAAAVSKALEKDATKEGLLAIIEQWQARLSSMVAEQKLRASGQ